MSLQRSDWTTKTVRSYSTGWLKQENMRELASYSLRCMWFVRFPLQDMCSPASSSLGMASPRSPPRRKKMLHCCRSSVQLKDEKQQRLQKSHYKNEHGHFQWCQSLYKSWSKKRVKQPSCAQKWLNLVHLSLKRCRSLQLYRNGLICRILTCPILQVPLQLFIWLCRGIAALDSLSQVMVADTEICCARLMSWRLRIKPSLQ